MKDQLHHAIDLFIMQPPEHKVPEEKMEFSLKLQMHQREVYTQEGKPLPTASDIMDDLNRSQEAEDEPPHDDAMQIHLGEEDVLIEEHPPKDKSMEEDDPSNKKA